MELGALLGRGAAVRAVQFCVCRLAHSSRLPGQTDWAPGRGEAAHLLRIEASVGRYVATLHHIHWALICRYMAHVTMLEMSL